MASNERVLRLEEELAEYKREFAELRSSDLLLKQSQKEVARLSKENALLKEESNSENNEAELLALVDDAEREALSKADEADAARSKVFSLENKILELEQFSTSRVDALEEELAEVTSQLESLRASKISTPVSTTRETDSLMSELRLAEKDNDELRALNAELRESVKSEKEKRNACVASQGESLLKLRQEHESQIAKLHSKIEDLNGRPSEEEFSRLKQRLDALQLADALNPDSNDGLSEKERVLLLKLREAQKYSASAKSELKKLQSVDVPRLERKISELEARSYSPRKPRTDDDDDDDDDRSEVSKQRDWFKQRVEELESLRERDLSTLTSLQASISTLKQDNVKMVRSIRFLQSRRECNDDTASKYSKDYESGIDPFRTFAASEAKRKKARLSSWELMLLEAVASRPTRTLVMGYLVCLHVVTFLSVWVHLHFDTELEMHESEGKMFVKSASSS